MGIQYRLTDEYDGQAGEALETGEEVRPCGRTRRSRESWRS
jgi:hypothetical protein